MLERYYLCHDCKAFYASIECIERGLNPLNTNLVVADASRTEKTICLAVSPSLKAYGVSGRPRLFEVIQKVNEINALRLFKMRKKEFSGGSYFDDELKAHPELQLQFIVAKPRMSLYMDYCTRIYNTYLKYIAPENIFAYSIDEVFIDVTHYLKTYKMTARELSMTMIKDVFKNTGITITAGVGTNMYLAKVAMDIVAKKCSPDENGVRIAELDEMSYREKLWNHRPLTDFWRIGKGYAKKLESRYIYTMGDIARCALDDTNSGRNEELLYKLFGVNTEILIDHAFGYEPVTLEQVKAYKPTENSISSGQVLQKPYDYGSARIIVTEMIDSLVLDLVDKGLVTNQIVLTICYDIENLTDTDIRNRYNGEIVTDGYGRSMPKHSHGTINIEEYTSSTRIITEKALELYDRIANKDLLIRKIGISANKVVSEQAVNDAPKFKQLDLFTDFESETEKAAMQKEALEREKGMQKTMLRIKKKYGKNAILKGTNFLENATMRDRNTQIGGHHE